MSAWAAAGKMAAQGLGGGFRALQARREARHRDKTRAWEAKYRDAVARRQAEANRQRNMGAALMSLAQTGSGMRL